DGRRHGTSIGDDTCPAGKKRASREGRQTVRRGKVAQQQFEAQALLRWRLLDRYVSDAAFCEGLVSLADQHSLGNADVPDWWRLHSAVEFDRTAPDDFPRQPMDRAVVAYVDAVEDFAKRRSEEHTSELQSRGHLVCRLLLEKKKI